MSHLYKKSYFVKDVDFVIAKELVSKFHYSGGGSNTRVYTHGLFHVDNPNECLGVAWWIPPTKSSAINTFPQGDWRKVLSLSRLVIHPSVPTNGASFLLSRSIKMIDKAKWHCIVTYADTWQGHTGQIYKATNWTYVGLTKPEAVYVNRDGLMMGRKRGGKTLLHSEMIEKGFVLKGRFAKHKFIMLLSTSHTPGREH